MQDQHIINSVVTKYIAVCPREWLGQYNGGNISSVSLRVHTRSHKIHLQPCARNKTAWMFGAWRSDGPLI